MRIVTWDADPPIFWDDKNLRWGNPSYLLEPGDEGYQPPDSTPATTKKKKGPRIMASNATPDNEDELIAALEDIDDGLVLHEVALNIKQNTHAATRADLTAHIGTAGPPAVTGTRKLYDMAQSAEGAARKALSDLDKDGEKYLGKVRKLIATHYGERWNAQWIATGFPNQSTAVPGKADLRYALHDELRNFFTQHPELEVNTPALVITAAELAARHAALSTARTALAAAKNARVAAGDACTASLQKLRDRHGGFVEELSRLIADDDSRWELFNLAIPADPDLPEAVAGLTLAPLGGGRLLAEWPRARRARRYRRFIQIVGVDADFRPLEPNFTGSGNPLQHILEDLPVGATVRLKLIAANESGDAPESNVAEAVVT